jgi:N-dimethylarginine dimethylaminohydrolase
MLLNRREALKSALLLAPTARSLGARVASPERAPIHVHDEFSRLKTVLVHDARNAEDIDIEDVERQPPELIAEHPETRLARREQIIDQQRRFCDLIDHAGVQLVFPDPLETAPSQIFTRDPSFVIDETLFLGALRDPCRRHEPTGLFSLCREVQRPIDLHQAETYIEGGDIFVLDRPRSLLIGTHRHTNQRGVRALTSHLPSNRPRVIVVPHHALHLDCCLAPLPDGTALYVPGKLPESSVKALREVFPRMAPIDRREGLLHLAANLFWLDPETVVSNLAAPITNRELRKRGYRVLAIEFSHITGIWGSFRCVTCPLVRAA